MTGEQMTGFDLLWMFLLIVALVAAGHGLRALAIRCGFLDDPWPDWEQTPGARTDRARLLEDEVR